MDMHDEVAGVSVTWHGLGHLINAIKMGQG